MPLAESAISHRVRCLRQRLNLTQERFADEVGVSVITVHRWETGQSSPRNLSLKRLGEIEDAYARSGVRASRFARGHAPVSGSTQVTASGRSRPLPPPNLDFNGDPDKLLLFVEGLRLKHGYQFNPAFASEISRIDPLPHQRIAVYERMLREEPLRFLLADDAGAGKTIMTGLYVREMLMRGRIRRVLVIPPAGLVGNWQRELRELFRLRFRVASGSDARAGNPFAGPESDLAIISLDTIRGETAFAALADPETPPYDLVVFDEAHKLSASSERGRVDKTQRYKLAEALAGCPPARAYSALRWSARHLLLLTATPHMGKDSPYHHLWRLLDHQVFGAEEAFRRFPQEARARHFIRRTKEEMVDFDGRPIFRERHCDTFGYDLTPGPDGERVLYDRTTSYLQHCYNLATGNQQAVRLAMGVFQRRLVSSIWALLKSFERRIAKVRRLITDLEEGRIDSTGLQRAQRRLYREHRSDYFDHHEATEDLRDDALRERAEDYEDAVLGAVVAVTVEELRQEVETLRDLSQRAKRLIDSGHESKFERLRELLESSRHAEEKWLVFSEHRDTVDFLVTRLEALGYAGRVATIHGGMTWPAREEQIERFRDPTGARFLIATDAAGEGINLQFCRLMVNYDIPWNPARLEQRMGRIHRYGQKHEVRIVNLVSTNTREGRVLKVLLERLEAIRNELRSDKVFDVLGRLFENRSLREHMRESLSDEGARRARNRIRAALTSDAVHGIGESEQARYGTGGDVVRRLGTLKGEVESERYLHLLPAYVRRFVELASPLLGLKIRGDLDGFFALAPLRAAAMDPLFGALETYPASARERLRVRRPTKNEPCVWLHPGEPVFDALCEQVLKACERDAARGAIFIDPWTEEPYLLHLGEVAVGEEGPAEGVGITSRYTSARDGDAHASDLGPRTLERCLVGLRQDDGGEGQEVPFEHIVLLQGAPNVPPGAVPLAARSVALRAQAAADLDAEAQDMADARREVMRTGVRKRRKRVGLNFNLKAADVARLRAELVRDADVDPEELEAVKRKQRDLGAQRMLALERLDAEPERIVPSEARFLAHALVLPPTGQGVVNAFDARVEDIAMRIASEWERGRGATVRDVSAPSSARMAGLGDYPGFDLLAVGDGGGRRHIEVKGRAGRSAVWMEINEWRAACHLGEEYWLYVVYGCGTATPKLVRVRDPFAKLVGKGTTRLRISVSDVIGAAEKDA